MDKTEIVKHLIDSRNETLWNRINEEYSVSFEKSTNGEYSCYSKDKNVTFYIADKLSIDSFAHEMLHVNLRLQNCFIGAGLKLTIGGSRILTSILSQPLIEHMGNCLDHIKMLPVFLDMGFKEELFIQDYYDHKCPADELRKLKNNYRDGKKINSTAVDSFVGKIFAIKACPNSNFNYSNELNQLQKIDPFLFNINIEMIEHWKQIKIENPRPEDEGYHSVLLTYYDNLKKWMTNKQFI